MKISIYVSKNFVDENTSIYKPLGFENRHIYHTNFDGIEEQGNQNFLRLDQTTKTTLKELYADGYTLKNVTNPQSFWHILFLEKD